MSGLLQDKVAIVTGGGTGIGAAIARTFAAQGCRVIVSGRRQDVLEKVAHDISGLAILADVSRESDVVALFDRCNKALGRLDILVNNAGYGGGGVMGIETVDVGAWDQTFAINTRGVMLCIKHAVPLLKRLGGIIVNIASTSGIKPSVRQIAYGASKAAVLNLTAAVAEELGVFGIRVNCLCPGAVDTDLYKRNAAARVAGAGGKIEDDMARIATSAALRRLTRPDEIASAALFLASDNSGTMTGTSIIMDAGKLLLP